MLPEKILDRYRVTKGDGFKLKDFDPDDFGNVDLSKKDGEDLLELGVKRLSRLQQRLYAEGKWAMLMVLQGIDTAGKDGVIKTHTRYRAAVYDPPPPEDVIAHAAELLGLPVPAEMTAENLIRSS